MELEDEFGDIIAKARIGTGLTASQLADQSGLSERDIQDIESYRLTPGSDEIDALAVALGLSAPKLAGIAGGWTPPPLDPSNEAFRLTTIRVPYGPYAENAYILGCLHTNLAAVVDPGGGVDEITRTLAEQGLRLHCVLVTHGHADHIGGLSMLVKTQPEITVVSSRFDRNAVMAGVNASWEDPEDGGSFALGKLRITALLTPGHTPGSTCYKTPGACFVGDTLFAGSIGRPAGQRVYREMLDAIRFKVLTLPAETALLPGHGPATTVDEEKLHNPFF